MNPNFIRRCKTVVGVISTVAKKIFAFGCQCYCMKWELKAGSCERISIFLHRNMCVCLPVDLSIISNFLGAQASNASKVQTSDASFKFWKTWIVQAIFFFLHAKFIYFYICCRKRNHKLRCVFSSFKMKIKCVRMDILPLHLPFKYPPIIMKWQFESHIFKFQAIYHQQ